MKESDIIYEKGDYFIIKVKTGYEVYKNGITHSTRCAQIGYHGDKGLQKSIQEIDRRIN
jgi:hypothetical protein